MIFSIMLIRRRRWGRLALIWVGFIVIVIVGIAVWLAFGPYIQLFRQGGFPSGTPDVPPDGMDYSDPSFGPGPDTFSPTRDLQGSPGGHNDFHGPPGEVSSQK